MIIPNSPVIRRVGGVVHDAGGRLLLVLRAHAPGRGQWPAPGGHRENGKPIVRRYTANFPEEAGLSVIAGRVLGRVPRPAPTGAYEIHDYACRTNEVALFPGDNTSDAMRASTATFATLDAEHRPTEVLADSLRAWEQLPRPSSRLRESDQWGNGNDQVESGETEIFPRIGTQESPVSPCPSTPGTAADRAENGEYRQPSAGPNHLADARGGQKEVRDCERQCRQRASE